MTLTAADALAHLPVALTSADAASRYQAERGHRTVAMVALRGAGPRWTFRLGTFDTEAEAQAVADAARDLPDVAMTGVCPPEQIGCEVPRELRAERFRAAIAARRAARELVSA